MSAFVKVEPQDRPVQVRRVEAGGDTVTLKPGEHETFTVRPHERLEISGDEAAVGSNPPLDLSGMDRVPPEEQSGLPGPGRD